MSIALELRENTVIGDALRWLKGLGGKRFGVMRTPEGDEFVVLRPEQLADLDAILGDPAFLAALERGIDDAGSGRTRAIPASESIRASLDAAIPCDASMAEAVERGVADAAQGRTHSLKPGQTLGALASRRPTA